MYGFDDTICAIATPPGMGGIGILRVSGPAAFKISGDFSGASKSFEKKRRLSFQKFIHPQTGEILDEGLLLAMPGPKSYTGEDVVEFHLHGSPSLLAYFLQLLVAAGARPADPGEFTYRAFLSGRLDLTQAEAVEELISAQGDASRRQALQQLTGGLAAYLEPLEEALKSLYLKIEARLEFSEDGIPPLDFEKFKQEVQAVLGQLTKLLESYRQGKILKNGLSVALVGPPNVGKSSLLNRLVGTNRAIVTPQAGTTRDVIEGQVLFKGIQVRFFDTAGLRTSSNVVEAEGIRRSQQLIEEADFIFWVIDSTQVGESIQELKNHPVDPLRSWFLFNKSDLAPTEKPWKKIPQLPATQCLSISCQTPEGIEPLLARMMELIEAPASSQDVLLTSARHQKETALAHQALVNLQSLFKEGRSYELWAEELREAALAIGRIRGRNLPGTAFEEIFTKFCIGK
jgi:tRNA modification GTPase